MVEDFRTQYAFFNGPVIDCNEIMKWKSVSCGMMRAGNGTRNNEFNWSGLNSSFNLLIRVHLLRDSKDLQDCWPFQREVEGTLSFHKYF